MRVKRKPLLFNAWHNSLDLNPNEDIPEPMPLWLRKVAENQAKPGTTFLVANIDQRYLCPANCIIVQRQDGKVFPLSQEEFKAEYDIVNVAKIPDKPEGEKL